MFDTGRGSAQVPAPRAARSTRIWALGVVVALVLSFACGSSVPARAVTSAFSVRHGELFDDAVDFMADPNAMDGSWAKRWQADLDGRVADSDVVAVIRVETLVSDTDPRKRGGLRLLPVAVRTLRGRLPPQTDLRVSEGRPGYVSVDANRSQIMADEFVLFLKWYQSEGSSVAAHWHLAPASDAVMARVEQAMGLRSDTTSHIVTHRE